MISGIKYIISDWDGTLVDSMQHYADSFADIMDKNFKVDTTAIKAYYLSTSGMALCDQFKEAAQKYANQSVENTQFLEEEFWNHQMESAPPPILNNVQKTLELLKEKGLIIVIWSGTRTDILGRKIKQTGLDRFITFYIGNTPNSDIQVKGPFLFEKIAQHLKISAESLRKSSLVIGDGIGDMIAGKNVKVKTIGVLKTTPEEKLKKFGADLIIESFSKLPNLLS